jgi:hypothetical protein
LALSEDEKLQPDTFEALVETTEAVLKTEQGGWTQGMREALAGLRAEKPVHGTTTSRRVKSVS